VAALEILMANNQANIGSFRLVIEKTFKRDIKVHSFTQKEPNDFIIDVTNSPQGMGDWVYVLCLWCMNPSISFAPLAAASRCVILTSGTLSPMDSFESELGVSFPLRLEANHVINIKKQLWAGSLSRVGTTSLNSSFKNTDMVCFFLTILSLFIFSRHRCQTSLSFRTALESVLLNTVK